MAKNSQIEAIKILVIILKFRHKKSPGIGDKGTAPKTYILSSNYVQYYMIPLLS